MESLKNFTIRKAIEADLNHVKALADAHKHELGFILRPILAKSINMGELFVATNNGVLAGFVEYHHRRDEQTTLHNIAVLPEYRHVGIGRQLIEALTGEAKELNQGYILLKCPEDLAANQFYEALGFELHKIEPGKKRPLKVWRLNF